MSSPFDTEDTPEMEKETGTRPQGGAGADKRGRLQQLNRMEEPCGNQEPALSPPSLPPPSAVFSLEHLATHFVLYL